MTLTKCTNVACRQLCINKLHDSIIQDERTQNLALADEVSKVHNAYCIKDKQDK